MSPRQKIANLYWKYPQPHTFDTDERLYRITGYVLEGDDYFLMGRGVSLYYDDEDIMDPGLLFPKVSQNCWFIHAFSGPMWKIFELAPYYLPNVAWTRRNLGLRVYDVEALRKKCGSKHTIFTTLAKTPA